MDKSSLNISWAGIAKVAIAIVALYVLFIVQDIIVWFLFAFIIGTLFNYLIDILEKKKIPRIVSAIVLYFSIFALLSFFIYYTAPIMKSELGELDVKIPEYLQRISPLFEKIGIEAFQNTETFFHTVKVRLESMSGSVSSALFSLFGGATSTILVLVMAFFISIERRFVERILGAFAPRRYRDYCFNLWARAKKKVSGWFITRIIGVIFVGASTYAVLRLFNVKYAFILAVLAGLFDLVPIVGPVAAGLAMFFFISLSSLGQAIFVGVAFTIIQLLENNLLFPILFKKFVGISPVLVLIALAVGGKMWGIAGAILSIPLAGVLFEILRDYLHRAHRKPEPAHESAPEEAIPVQQDNVSIERPEL